MQKTTLALSISLGALLSMTMPALAQTTDAIQIKMQLLDPIKGNHDIGTVTVTESAYGLVFTPKLTHLTMGLHGFHIHEHPSCAPQQHHGKMITGFAAGGHWDPHQTQTHGFPWANDAHLGDLPALAVNHEGQADNPVLAPRLRKLSDIKGRSLMIHVGADNHADHPVMLGGGGARMACGIISPS